MRYEPLKDMLASLLEAMPGARNFMFAMLDLMLLRQRYVKAAIRRQFPAGKPFRMYDAGAGYCQYTWFVLREWPQSKVFALDLKAGYIRDFAAWLPEHLRSRFSFTEGDLQHYEPKNSYDLVIAVDILEHIPDDLAVLRHFYSCLKPGGKLIISTPSDTDEAARFTAEHVRPGYSLADLSLKLQDTGFEIIDSRYSYGRFGSLAWKLSIRLPLKMIGRSKLSAVLLPLYYLPFLPLSFLLNWLDTKAVNKSGTGIIVVAAKPL